MGVGTRDMYRTHSRAFARVSEHVRYALGAHPHVLKRLPSAYRRFFRTPRLRAESTIIAGKYKNFEEARHYFWVAIENAGSIAKRVALWLRCLGLFNAEAPRDAVPL